MENLSDHIRSHYSTVFITLCSVLLGLCLADVVSILRNAEHHTWMLWLQAGFVIALIFNAWVAFATHAITVRVIPTIGDSFLVFAVAGGNFAITAFVGTAPYLFWTGVGAYALIAIVVNAFTILRIKKDPNIEFVVSGTAPLVICSVCQVLGGFAVAALSYSNLIDDAIQPALCAVGYVFPLTWLWLYRRVIQRFIPAFEG